MDDAGVSLGSALAWHQARGGVVPHLTSPYLSTNWSDEDISAELQRGNLGEVLVEHCSADRVCERAAQDLATGRIIGWFQGPGEVGKRALGARSILADPRSRGTLTRVNHIKQREEWRPLAPAILAENYCELMETEVVPPAARYMLVAQPVRAGMRRRISACVHVDGTARAQAVYEDDSPEFATLLRRFYELSGVPVLLNTSLNGPREPIVYRPGEALAVFLDSELDCLAIGSFYLTKHSPSS